METSYDPDNVHNVEELYIIPEDEELPDLEERDPLSISNDEIPDESSTCHENFYAASSTDSLERQYFRSLVTPKEPLDVTFNIISVPIIDDVVHQHENTQNSLTSAESTEEPFCLPIHLVKQEELSDDEENLPTSCLPIDVTVKKTRTRAKPKKKRACGSIVTRFSPKKLRERRDKIRLKRLEKKAAEALQSEDKSFQCVDVSQVKDDCDDFTITLQNPEVLSKQCRVNRRTKVKAEQLQREWTEKYKTRSEEEILVLQAKKEHRLLMNRQKYRERVALGSKNPARQSIQNKKKAPLQKKKKRKNTKKDLTNQCTVADVDLAEDPSTWIDLSCVKVEITEQSESSYIPPDVDVTCRQESSVCVGGTMTSAEKLRRTREYYYMNRETILMKSKEQYYKDGDKNRMRAREHYHKNREANLKRKREYYNKIRDRKNELKREYYEKHKDYMQWKGRENGRKKAALKRMTANLMHDEVSSLT